MVIHKVSRVLKSSSLAAFTRSLLDEASTKENNGEIFHDHHAWQVYWYAVIMLSSPVDAASHRLVLSLLAFTTSAGGDGNSILRLERRRTHTTAKQGVMSSKFYLLTLKNSHKIKY